jgi:hypothetical protein
MTSTLHILAYDKGVQDALEKLGATKLAVGLRKKLIKALQGQHGELMTRVPVQAAMGGLAGAGTGSMSDHTLEGALLGTLTGGLGGVAVAGAPKIRSAAIKKLKAMGRT